MNVFELEAKIGADTSGFEKGLSGARGTLSKFGTIAKAGFAATATAAAGAAVGVAKITKASTEAYATFEQMKGGVEKLYGSDAQTVMDNASKAFETAGMSANQYMDTATQFSASLINSLGGDTKKAAAQTDVAMKAMSDNVNVFGSNAEDVSNAFKGFSKQNYTMLDNLKLGYGGTKDEMERLIKDANEWGKANGEASNLSIDSFSDVVTAIQQVQEKQGIAGTTANEAATTIEGSITMAKSAWENLLTGFGDEDADISGLVTNLSTSVQSVVDNVMPRVQQVLSGISEALPQLVSTITTNLPTLVSSILPGLTSAVMTLVQTAGQLIVQYTPSLLSFISSAASTLLSMLPSAISGVGNFASMLVTQGTQLVQGLAEGVKANSGAIITSAMNALVQFADTIATNAPTLLTTRLDLILNIVEGISQNLPTLVASAYDIIQKLAVGIIQHLPELLVTGVKIIVSLVTGIANAIPEMIKGIDDVIKSMIEAFQEVDWAQVGKDILKAIKEGILENSVWNDIGGKIYDKIHGISSDDAGESTTTAAPVTTTASTGSSDVGSSILASLSSESTKQSAFTAGTQVISSFSNGMTQSKAMSEAAAHGVSGSVPEALRYNETSMFAAGTNTVNSYASGITGNTSAAQTATQGVASTVESTAQSYKPTVSIGVETSEASLHLGNLNTTLSSVGEQMSRSATSISQKVANAFGNMGLSVSTKVTSMSSTVQNTLSAMSMNVSRIIASMSASVSSQASGFYTAGYNIGTNFDSGLVRGINAGVPSIINAATNAATEAYNAAYNRLKEGSPSRLMAEVGKNYSLGFANGIANYGSAVTDAAQTVTDSAASVAGNYIGISSGTSQYGSGANTGTVINVNVASPNISSDYDTDRFARRLSETLGNLQVRQSHGMGVRV